MTQSQKQELTQMLRDEIHALTEQIGTTKFTTEPCPDETDQASQVTQQGLNVVIERRCLARLNELETALKRLYEDSYGVCEECGETISVARLKANPSARLCVVCQSEVEDGLKLCA